MKKLKWVKMRSSSIVDTSKYENYPSKTWFYPSHMGNILNSIIKYIKHYINYNIFRKETRGAKITPEEPKKYEEMNDEEKGNF